MGTTKLSPRSATQRDLDRLYLREEGYSTKEAWILRDCGTIAISTQKNGEAPTGRVEISKRTFDALVDWYTREQPTKERHND